MAAAESSWSNYCTEFMKYHVPEALVSSLASTAQQGRRTVRRVFLLHLRQTPPTLPAGAFKSLDPRYWQDAELLKAWCQVLYLSQLVESRLLLDVKLLKKHVGFWNQKMTSTSSRQFMLLGQGPVSFARDMMSMMGWAKGAQTDAMHDIASKVVVLQQLEKTFSTALAEVHSATGTLLQQSQALLSQQQAVDSKSGADNNEGKEAQEKADIWQAFIKCLDQLTAALRPCLEDLPGSSETSTPAGAQDEKRKSHREGDQQQLFAFHVETVKSTIQAEGLNTACRTVEAAMESATQEAQLHGGFLNSKLGPSLRMPSHLQQHWISYTLLGGASAVLALWLYRHSPLAGSDDIPRWIKGGWLSLTGATEARVVKPLMSLRDDFFDTLRSRPGMSSQSVFEQDRASLIKMMRDFEADQASTKVNMSDTGGVDSGRGVTAIEAADEAAVAEGLKVIRASYEADVKRPITALVTGTLSRSLLIQVAKMKLDLAAAMLQLDQILRANELSISLIAATPALLITAALSSALWKVVQPPPPDPKKDALPCRLALLQLIQLLESHRQGWPQESSQSTVMEGAFLSQLNEVYQLAWNVFRLHHFAVLGVKHSEWHLLREDLLLLAQPLPQADRLHLLSRMMATFSILQPA